MLKICRNDVPGNRDESAYRGILPYGQVTKAARCGPQHIRPYRHKTVLRDAQCAKVNGFVDLGAGSGDYTIPLAEAAGPEGRIYAVDAWAEGLTQVSPP